MNSTAILRVAINVPLSREFDYRPLDDRAAVRPGSRVIVPFGRQRQIGVVMGNATSSHLPADRIRQCTAVLDETRLLADEDLRLIRFASDYYHHPIGEVVAAALPALLRQGKALLPTHQFVAISNIGEATDIEALAKRAPRQAELLALLADAGGDGTNVESLGEQMPAWKRAAKSLLEKGLIVRFEAVVELSAARPGLIAQTGPELNEDQKSALAAIRAQTGFGTFLIDGVTGSGKTEVYLEAMRDALCDDRQVLILVPEIGLTPQLVSRLRERLGVDPAVLHSGLSDSERLSAWRDAQQGSAGLVIGTRSAVFTPLPKLGLIVVDEEHDQSLKQQEGLRYSARDLAIVRAKYRDIKILLGSATPTLDSLQHCRAGNYQLIVMPERAGGAKPPSMRLVDLSRSTMIDGLSDPLAEAIAKHQHAGGQVLLFLNRRGFAPTLICSSCGHVAECDRCDSRMTVHARDHCLRCHHCGASRPLVDHCTECGATVRPLGEGTERLEDALRRRFADARVQRVDSDSTRARGAIAAALAAAQEGDADILVGTQMLSKGHHFPKLTLVGVINADQGLFGADFRASERLAQSIVQVAGRAGRESRPGEVMIQTAFPEHPFWHRLIEGGYQRVADDALAEREASGWPPFTRLALIRASSHKQRDAHQFLGTARQLATVHASNYFRVLGPVDAPMARKAGRYRAQLLLQSSSRKTLHEVLTELRPALEPQPVARRVRWSIDVDPIELF